MRLPDATTTSVRWNHSQRPSTAELVRPLTTEELIREARDAGYDGPQRKLVRLIRSYVDARTDWSFAAWLGYSDPTGDSAVRNLAKAGGQRG